MSEKTFAGLLRKKFPSLSSLVSDGNTSFLRAARAGNLEKVLEYLRSDIDINTCNANGLNALHLASKDGHLQVVTELLKRGAAVDTATKKGNTALHIASLAGQEDIVKILLLHNASVNVQSQNGFTPLYMAAQENHDTVVKLLLTNGANQGLATEDGFTPLAVAMQQGHDKVVTVLLENDTRGKVRLPALHIAAKKDDVRAATLLLENDHNPDVTSKSGFTPLHIASHYGNEAIANILIQKGANVNYFAKHNISPLHVAAKWGKTNLVSLLLEKGGYIGNKTRDGLTPLHCAARSGHEQVVDMLLERGAPISAKTKNGLTPLHMAAQGEHIDAARILLYHRAPVDEVTIDYLTALHVAAHCGHVRVAKLLLDRSADPNARALNGFTPLHIACKKNRIKVVELLLKHGASIGATTESGLTPLHVASFMGCMNIVIYLLQHEACPDVPTVRGETPLHLAARANQTDIIRILLRNGALVDARAREQQTPLHIAARLGNVDNVMLLLQHGAHVDSTTKDMYTALHIAVKEGQDEVAGVLIENGASLDATTKKGFTSLHLTAKYSHTKVAKLLLQKDAAVDAQGKNGVTPLHVASHYDNHPVALMLLERGASPHSIAKNGHTPLHIAARKNQMDIATTLLEYGANADAESKAGFTPLHLCSQEGNAEMSSILLEHKANMNHPAKNGLTPMHLCAQEDMVNVAKVLIQKGANIELTTRAGYTPLHVAAHFGQARMVRYLLMNGAKVDVATSIGYTPLHQAAQQGHSHIVNILIEHNANPNLKTSNGQTALHIADRLGYISVLDSLKAVTNQSLPSTQEEKYRVVAPETMHETFMSDSEEEGGDDILLSDQPYRYLTVDEMKSLGDDSLPIDVTRDERVDSNRMAQTADSSSNSPQTTESIICPQRVSSFSADKVTKKLSVKVNDAQMHKSTERIGFLVSFMVDARGGAMRGCRHSGVRMIIPSQTAFEPTRITCRYVKHQRTIHPPQLMEGEALASRILELGPAGTKFLGPVILELPHFASLRGKEREIVILRSDNGETWREHNVENSEEIIHDILHQSFETEDTRKLDEMSGGGRICRFVSYDIPVYVAVVSRIRQEVHAIGPEGGMVSSTVVAQVQAVFPQGALTKKIKVGLQAQPIDPDLTAKLLGRGVAVSPIVTVEPRRRKFHKAITLNMPAPKAHSQGMINQYAGNAPTLRLLCSITGGATRAQWEDVTGSTPLTFVNDCVSFTTTVSARFWLMDCRNISEATRMAAELYREAIHVPFIANFAVYAKRIDAFEAQLRVFCITDDKTEKTLEYYEHFIEVAKSRDVEVLEGKSQFIEIAGNLVAVTKSGDQLQLPFNAFRENRLPFNVRVKDQHADVVGRTLFMREPKIPKGEQPQQPICILNIVLPEKNNSEKNFVFYDTKKLANVTTGPYDSEGLNLFGDFRTVDISNLLGEDWKPLALYLGFTRGEVEAIQEKNPMSTAHQAQAMMRQFLIKNKNDINILRLGLESIGREDIIERSSQVLNPRKVETIPLQASHFQDRIMENLTEREEIKYSAEEKFVEDSDSDDNIEKKSVAERRQKIERWLSEDRQIPASTQKLEIVQEITEIKRKSLIEDKKARHEEEIMLQMAANFKVKSSEVPDHAATLKGTKQNKTGKDRGDSSEESNENLVTTGSESEKCFQKNEFSIPEKKHYEVKQLNAIASDSIVPCDIQPQYEDCKARPVTLDPKIEETSSGFEYIENRMTYTLEESQHEIISKDSITGFEKPSSSITKFQTECNNVRESQKPRGQLAEEYGDLLPNNTSGQLVVSSPHQTIEDKFFPDSTKEFVSIEDYGISTATGFPSVKPDVPSPSPRTSREMSMISNDNINDMKPARGQVKGRYAMQLPQKSLLEYPKTVDLRYYDSTTDAVMLPIPKSNREVSTQGIEKRGLLGSISFEEIQSINLINRNFGCGSKHKSDGDLNKKYSWQKDVSKPSKTVDFRQVRSIDLEVRSANEVRHSDDLAPAHRILEQASFYIGESSANIIKKSTSCNDQTDTGELGGHRRIKETSVDFSTDAEVVTKSNASFKETKDLISELGGSNIPEKATFANKLFRKDSETRNDILELDQPVEIFHANSYKIEANSNSNTTALKNEVGSSSEWELRISAFPVEQQMPTEDAKILQSESFIEETVDRESEEFSSLPSGMAAYDQAIDMTAVPKISKSDINFDKSEVEPSEKSFSNICYESVSSSHQLLSSPVESLHLNAFQLVADQVDESLVEKTFQEVEYSLDAVQEKLMEVVKDSEYIKQSPSEFEFKSLPQVSLDCAVIDIRLQDNIQSKSECTSESLDSLQNEIPSSLRCLPSSSLQSGVLDASAEYAPNQIVISDKVYTEHKSESLSLCSGPCLDQSRSSSDSQFQSFEKTNSRPCSSDVENLITHGNFSEYQTACDVSSPFQQGSTEYISAVSTLDYSNKTISSHESMRSLGSENSTNLGDVEVSEISETLVPLVDEGDYDEEAELDCDDDVSEFPEVKNNFTLISPNNISKDDFGMKDTSQVQSMMKRSQEMTFALGKGTTLETSYCVDKSEDSIDKSASQGVPEQDDDSVKQDEGGRGTDLLIATPNQLRDSLIEDLDDSGKHSFLENERNFHERNPNTTLTEQAAMKEYDASSLDSKETRSPSVKEKSIEAESDSPYESEYKHAYKVPLVKPKCIDTSRTEEQLISLPHVITETKELAQSMQINSNEPIETIGKNETDSIIVTEEMQDEDLNKNMTKEELICFKNGTEDAWTQNMTDGKIQNIEDRLSYDKIERFDGGERDGLKADSPDSFEMLEQPDLSDDFVIIEEVAKEASEFDMEGKGIRIKNVTYVKKHDDEVEKIVVRSAPAAPNEGSLMYMHPDGLNFHFEESPPTPHDQTEVGTIDTQNMHKKWVEMQLSDNASSLRYPYEVERGILEDIKEEDVEGDFSSSRLSSYKDSYSSTPDYDILVGRRRVTREQDEVSMNSLQEFENLEQAISLENKRYRQRDDSQDSFSNGSLTRRYLVRCSGQGDDTSLSSLKEFEGLENACLEAHLIEIKAKEEAALLLSRSNDSSKSDPNTGKPNKMGDASEVVVSTQTCSVNVKSVLQIEPELKLDSSSVSVKAAENFELSQPSKQLAEGENRHPNVVKMSAYSFKGEISNAEQIWFQEGSHVGSCESLEISKCTANTMISSADSFELSKDLSVRSSHSEIDSLEQQLPTQSLRSFSVDSIKHLYSNSAENPVGELVKSGGLPDIAIRDGKPAKEHSCDSLNLNQTDSDRLVNSTDSLDHTSSGATYATCQHEIDSMMSGSMTSCGSNTLVEYLEVTFAETPCQSTGPSSHTQLKGLKARKLISTQPTDHHKSAHLPDGDECKSSDDKTDENP